MGLQRSEIKIKNPVSRLIICFVFLAMFYSPACAQYTKVYEYKDVTHGIAPGPLISDGTFLYGMTWGGGIFGWGTIFKIKPDGSGYVKLLDFDDGSNGRTPQGPLIFDGTFLYGMTSQGGANGYGTIFKIKPDGSGYVKLLDFDGTTNGYYPSFSLFSDGTFLYGMTFGGGKNDYGTIFKIKPDRSGYVRLLDFVGATNGRSPQGPLISDGTFLYGMTSQGGANNHGTIFKIKPDGKGYLKLLDFDGATNGRNPNSSLISDGTFLYGMTYRGGTNDSGTIFKIKPDGSGYVKLLDFDRATTGALPIGSLITDGTFLYGVTSQGGTNNLGTIFKLKPDGKGYEILRDFDGAKEEYYPRGSLITDGIFLYGSLWGRNGNNNYGTIFKYCLRPTASTDTITACGSYKWHGKTYTISGAYKHTIPNAEGCDSVMTLHLTINSPTSDSLSITSCNNYVNPSGKYTYNSTGYYNDTIPNSVGCDSILRIHFIKTSIGDSLSIKSCKPIKSPSGKYTYESTGYYYDTLSSSQGCDSVLRIHFVKTAIGDSLSIKSCKPFKSPSGKYILNSTGYYYDTIPNNLGCDSVLTIHFIKNTINNTVAVKSCDTVVSPSGKYIYRTSGIYTDTLKTIQNCDSIITINVTIKPFQLTVSKSNNIGCDTPYAILSATGGDFYNWEPAEGLSDANAANPIATPKASRTYYLTATNNFGCSTRDSIVVIVEKKDSLGFIPNLITPNNDGYNDCFNVSTLTQFKIIELTVFNRWGNIVFNTTDPNACWDGKTLSGNNLSEGVYYYVLSGTGYCNEKINRQGTITLIR